MRVSGVWRARLCCSALVIDGAHGPEPAIIADWESPGRGGELHAATTSGHMHFVMGRLGQRTYLYDAPTLQEPQPAEASAVLLGGRAASNYFHWWVEHLTKLRFLVDDPDAKRRALVVNEQLPPQFMEALQAILGGPWPGGMLFWRQPQALNCAELMVLTHPAVTAEDPGAGPEAMLRCEPDDLRWLADRVLAELREQDRSGCRRLHLARNGDRRAVSAEPLAQVLEARGFETIAPETLTFAEQVRLFREAEIIVSSSGAALTNIIFCRPGTQVIILNAMRHRQNPVFQILGSAAGVDVVQAVGPQQSAPPTYGPAADLDALHQPYVVSARTLANALDHAERRLAQARAASAETQ